MFLRTRAGFYRWVAGPVDFSVTPLDGASQDRVSRPFVQADGVISDPRFSPDGRWVLYTRSSRPGLPDDSGGLFVQPFPGPGRRQFVAPPGYFSEWRRDGKEIVYFGQDGIMSVTVEETGHRTRFGPAQKLFSGLRVPAGSNASIRPLAISRDGSRIYFVQGVEQPDSNLIHIETGLLK